MLDFVLLNLKVLPQVHFACQTEVAAISVYFYKFYKLEK